MPHFFVKSNNINNNEIIIDDKENFNHISKSLRAKIGEKLLLIDENQKKYETVIFEISKNIIKCEIKNKYKSNRDLGFNLFLAQSPLRSDAQNFIIEKATELGVRGIYPVVTENCVLKKSVIEAKIEKWQKCMYEASKQCERAIVPICYEASSLEDVLGKNFDKVLVMAERSCELCLKNYLIENPIEKNENVLVIIGPEGGFSQKEFDFFKDKNLCLITLGDLILKAETAVVVALGNIIYEFNGR